MNTNCVPKYLRSGQTQANNHLLKKSTYNKYTFIHRTSIQIDLFFPLLFSFFRNFSHWCYVDPHYCVLAYKSVRSILPAHPLIVCYNANQVQGSSANPAFSCTSCFSRYVSVNDSWLSLLFSPWWHTVKKNIGWNARQGLQWKGFFFSCWISNTCAPCHPVCSRRPTQWQSWPEHVLDFGWNAVSPQGTGLTPKRSEWLLYSDTAHWQLTITRYVHSRLSPIERLQLCDLLQKIVQYFKGNQLHCKMFIFARTGHQFGKCLYLH